MIKLTKFDPFGGTEMGPVWFAWNGFASIEPDWVSVGAERGAVLYRHGDPKFVRVRESAEQVLDLVRAEERRTHPLMRVVLDGEGRVAEIERVMTELADAAGLLFDPPSEDGV